MNVKVIGVDLAKSVFQVCVQLEDGSIKSNHRVQRSKLLDAIRQYPANTLVAMEACATAHYWGRAFVAAGFKVKLLPAQHVKPFARRQKNDANDAIAICEAAFRPKLHGVPLKSVEQQDIKALRCVRNRLISQRTAMTNQLRGLAAEYGVVTHKSLGKLRNELATALEDAENDFSTVLRALCARLLDDWRVLDHEINEITEQLQSLCQQQSAYRNLLSIPGFGPILTATFMSEIGNGEQFCNGRQLATWCGLVPLQHSSGDKKTLGRITKNGNCELRTLLIHGARAVVAHVGKREDALGRWLKELITRRGKAKAIVALANKLARIGWAISHSGKKFDMSQACKAA